MMAGNKPATITNTSVLTQPNRHTINPRTSKLKLIPVVNSQVKSGITIVSQTRVRDRAQVAAVAVPRATIDHRFRL